MEEATTLIPGKLAFGPRGSSTQRQRPLAFHDIAAPEFRRGRFEVCHFRRKDLGVAVGPLAIDQTLWFAHELHMRLKHSSDLIVVEYSLEERRNAAALVGAYLVLALGWSASDVGRLMPKDAGMRFPCCWLTQSELAKPRGAPQMLVQDCWQGVEMARKLGWLQAALLEDATRTSLAASQFWKTVVEYDGAWIAPGEVFVMADPVTTFHDPDPRTCRGWAPEPMDAERGPDGEEEEISEPPSPCATTFDLCQASMMVREWELAKAPDRRGVLDYLLDLTCISTSKEMFPSERPFGSTRSTTLTSLDLGDSTAQSSLELEGHLSEVQSISVFSACKDYAPGSAVSGHGCELWPEPKPMAEFLRDEGVGGVVRANVGSEPGLKDIGGSYDPAVLSEHGILHADVYISDSTKVGNGAVPKTAVIRRFLEEAAGMQAASEAGRRALCIHCKGGFGRSVLLAAVLIVHRHDVSGRAVLGWVRIARPGAIATPEQEAFLCSLTGRADLDRVCRTDLAREESLSKIGVSERRADARAQQACCTIS